MHQQQQPAAAGKNDGGGAGKLVDHDRGLPGWHAAALQLRVRLLARGRG
jgi:hypothetical protein